MAKEAFGLRSRVSEFECESTAKEPNTEIDVATGPNVEIDAAREPYAKFDAVEEEFDTTKEKFDVAKEPNAEIDVAKELNAEIDSQGEGMMAYLADFGLAVQFVKFSFPCNFRRSSHDRFCCFAWWVLWEALRPSRLLGYSKILQLEG